MEIDSPLEGQSERIGFRHSAALPGSQQINNSDKQNQSRGDANRDLRSKDVNLDLSFDIGRAHSSPVVPLLPQGEPSTFQEPSPFLLTDEVLQGREKEEMSQNKRDGRPSLMPLYNPFLVDGDDELVVNPVDSLGGSSGFPEVEKAGSEEESPSMPFKAHEEDSTWVNARTDRDNRDVFAVHGAIGMYGAISGDSSDTGPIPSSQGDTLFNEPGSLDRKIEVRVVKAPGITSHVARHDVLESVETPLLESDSTTDKLEITSNMAVLEVVDEMRSEGTASAPEPSTTHSKAEETDLAALWEAALEDDELLEDDEQCLDPSAYFEDDRKDFLWSQPTEETRTNLSAEPISKPFIPINDHSAEFNHAYDRIKTHSPVLQVGLSPYFHQRHLNLSSEASVHQDVIGAQRSSSKIPALDIQISPTLLDSIEPSGQQEYSFYAQTTSRPHMPDTAQSFSDKSKDGYTSPYDMPMELTRPKKRTQLQNVQTASDTRGSLHFYPPPRSSSIQAEAFTTTLASKSSNSTVSGGKFLDEDDKRTTSATFHVHNIEVKPSTDSFFEDLSQKTPSQLGTRATPVALAIQPTQSLESQLRRKLPRGNTLTQPPVLSSSGSPQPYQLLPPERLSLYAHSPRQEFVGQTFNSKTRHSPALTRPASTNHPGLHRHAPSPESFSQIPAPSSRYSPAPARPASANLQGSLSYLESPNSRAPQRIISQARSISQRFDFIRPSDGREKDPLERWKGCPIFSFGFGGMSVSSFPKQIPRYPAGQNLPMIKCSPGEVKLHAGMVIPLDEYVSSFPGPLKSKSKKKELLDWMQGRIIQLANCEIHVANDSVRPDPRKRHEEKIILWEIIRILVEHDGVMEGNSSVILAVRCLLSPEVAPSNITNNALILSSQSSHQYFSGIKKYDRSRQDSKPPNPDAIEALRKILLQGEQEKAVWYAADQRLWAHSLILASTLHPDIWRQALQEFIRQEIRTFGHNTESLASFYQVLARNWEESIDELVPPSARAGHPMVTGLEQTGLSTNALDGLDRWRETLTLILSNRSQDDWKALLALGEMLCIYGRIEAAHICFIFAKSSGLFGGVDDNQVRVALIGADHITYPLDYCRDLDSILLTEVYDFSLTVLKPSIAKTFSPHLQSYKLYHALMLAEYGYRSEAQQYCDTITSALKFTTTTPPFFHGILYGVLGDLVERLRQVPSDDSASWISRPSMDKVSGSVWTRLNQFIAGDDSDTGSAASGRTIEPDVSGPFAHVVGDSPSVSQKASMSDIHNSYPDVETRLATKLPPNSRYAPAKQSTPRSSLDHAQSRPTQEPRREVVEDHKPSMTQRQHHLEDSSAIGMSQEPPSNLYIPSHGHRGYMQSPGFSSFSHDSALDHIPQSAPKNNLEKAEPGANEDDLQKRYQPVAETYPPPSSIRKPQILDHISASFNETLVIATSQPHTFNSYLPPSYTPDLGTSDTLQEDEDRLLTNGEDEAEKIASATKSKLEMGKKEPDVDEAFRKAAEADGMFLFTSQISYVFQISSFPLTQSPIPLSKKSFLSGH